MHICMTGASRVGGALPRITTNSARRIYYLSCAPFSTLPSDVLTWLSPLGALLYAGLSLHIHPSWPTTGLPSCSVCYVWRAPCTLWKFQIMGARSVCIPLPAPCDDVHCLVRVLPPVCSPSRPISLSMDSRICSLAIIRSASHAVDTVGCHYVQISSAHLFFVYLCMFYYD